MRAFAVRESHSHTQGIHLLCVCVCACACVRVFVSQAAQRNAHKQERTQKTAMGINQSLAQWRVRERGGERECVCATAVRGNCVCECVRAESISHTPNIVVCVSE